MTISKEEIKHIASLARLELTDEEIAKYDDQLNNILEFFGQLSLIKDEELPVDDQGALQPSILRQDEVDHIDQTQKILHNSADVEKNQFKIPPVF